MSQRSEGGEGSTLIGTLSQIFSIFYFDASPKTPVYQNRAHIKFWVEFDLSETSLCGGMGALFLGEASK